VRVTASRKEACFADAGVTCFFEDALLTAFAEGFDALSNALLAPAEYRFSDLFLSIIILVLILFYDFVIYKTYLRVC
jgi:hypothetical protein